MHTIELLFLGLPLLGLFLTTLFKNHQEKEISNIAIVLTFVQMVFSIGFGFSWFINAWPPITKTIFTIYQEPGFRFGFDLYYDHLSAIYSCVASIILFIVAIFSKTYMHRESGFKRYFSHFMLFNFGFNVIMVAGSFEFLFLGWEVVGISSFLLIAFYRERYLPVRNAMKVLSFYRMGDIALLGAIWFCHHLFHENILFNRLENYNQIHTLIAEHPQRAWIISFLFIMAATIKSAQFPFSSWIPRAMEGPTVSSAVFYGSISVHLGVFILLRTAPLWDQFISLKIMLGLIGFSTAIISTLICRVQSTAKTQIAYSTISQIGLIFVEISLGLYSIALIHFSANAILRTYQLLISPASLSYLVHQQFFNYDPNKKPAFEFLPKKWRNSLYILSLKEWNLDYIWYRYLWMPLKKTGKSFHFLRANHFLVIFALMIFIGSSFAIIRPISFIPYHYYISLVFSFTAFILILIAWTERFSALRSWNFMGLSQSLFMLSIAYQHGIGLTEIVLYLSGTLGAYLGGVFCLYQVKSKENGIHLNEFHGHIYEHPKFALLFLVCSLTMIGFPISPTFLGYDLLLSEIELNQWALLLLSAIIFVLLEITVIRIYSRVFLGQHIKTYHEVAFRNS